MEPQYSNGRAFDPAGLRLRGPYIQHVAWLKFLLSLPDSKAISRAARAVGEMQYLTSPRARKKIEHRYNDYLAIAGPIAEERGITLPSAKCLTRQNYIQKPISSIAPALIASADEKQFMGLLDISGVEEAEAAYRANTGLVLCSMHHSAMGVAVGYLARHLRAPLTTIRDGQFKVFEGTEYGKGYLMGADTIFVDGRDPTSGQAALMKCARRLRNKHLVAYTPDSYNGSRSRVGTILGRDAFVKTGIAKIAASAQVPICLSCTAPVGNKLKVMLSKPFYLEKENAEEEFAKIYLAWVEETLLKYPGMIFWLRYYRELFDPRSAGARDLEHPPVKPDTEFKRPRARKKAGPARA